MSETPTRPLVAFGFFAETDGQGPPFGDAPRIPLEPAEREAIIDYLRSAPAVIEGASIVSDPIDETVVLGVHRIRSDGAFVWPDTASALIARHDLAVPDLLRAAARTNRYVAPELDVAERAAVVAALIAGQVIGASLDATPAQGFAALDQVIAAEEQP